MSDPDLVRAFEDTTLSPASFHHRDHIAVAFRYLQGAPFGEAGERFCTNLRRFAAAHGKPSLFHATITWAYVALVQERMVDGPPDLAGFAAANADLFDHADGAIARCYDAETLASERARRVFVLPRSR